MAWYWIVALALVALALTVLIVGSLLPRDHSVERSRQIHGTPEAVFATIADLPNRTRWVAGLKQVMIEPGGRFYTEVHDMGPLRMELVESSSPARLITRIADDALPFGGTWTISIVPAGANSTVTIREDGFVKSPIFRFVSRFIMGHTRTMDQFLSSLSTQFPQ